MLHCSTAFEHNNVPFAGSLVCIDDARQKSECETKNNSETCKSYRITS